MKTLYLDCQMGAAGDMLTAALYELLSPEEKEAFLAEMNSCGLGSVSFTAEPAVKCGVTGTHMKVLVDGEEEESADIHGHDHHHEHEHDHDHHHDHEHGHGHSHSHTGMAGIEHLVRDHLTLSDKVKDDIMAVYGRIAAAESAVHGVPVTDIHFHEVGTMDAVADVAAVCRLMEMLSPDEVIASPVHVGSGQVRCAHGILPVPAPATALILKEVPIYSGSIKGELCTPTGAALLTHFVDHFGEMPVMRPEAIGYGCGKKDFEAANCVRAILGKTGGSTATIVELFCNIDDMTPEALSFAMERLFDAGAVEVFTTPIGMKKSRTGILLSVMCREADREKIIELIFRHTTTIGIRERVSKRYTLARRIETVDTPFGPIRRKVSEGFGVCRGKYEYDDLAAVAREKGLSIREILEKLP